MSPDPRPLVVHVVFRFAVGGLENGLVNLINRMPPDAYRHKVVALTDCDPEFCARVQRPDIEYISLHKPPGQGVIQFPALYRIFRNLRPAIVHTRNLAALEASVPAWSAGVPIRIHGEHGRDVHDRDGSSIRYRLVRRMYRPFVSHYIALSGELQTYLRQRIGVPELRISQIYNGVDTDRFTPYGRRAEFMPGFIGEDSWVFGTVGRMQFIKDPGNLARAFVLAVQKAGAKGRRLRLLMVGDGPLRREVEDVLLEGRVRQQAWLVGERSDVPELLRSMDCFVLPSRGEGIANGILEAMASSLPVTATRVGGNPEIVDEGVTGFLVPPEDPHALAEAMLGHFRAPQKARAQGAAGRKRVEDCFSLSAMVQRYAHEYDRQLAHSSRAAGRN
jgi:sugar transferase (PEP-CTERM/EpsH1 system associated)